MERSTFSLAVTIWYGGGGQVGFEGLAVFGEKLVPLADLALEVLDRPPELAQAGGGEIGASPGRVGQRVLRAFRWKRIFSLSGAMSEDFTT